MLQHKSTTITSELRNYLEVPKNNLQFVPLCETAVPLCVSIAQRGTASLRRKHYLCKSVDNSQPFPRIIFKGIRAPLAS